MARMLVAGVAGAVVIYVWGMLAWMVLPLHTPYLHGLPDEAAVSQRLTADNLETGVYVAPWTDNEDDWGNEESEFMTNHRAGPIFTIYYRAEGAEVMGPDVLLFGFLIDLAAALLAACLLTAVASGCCRGYWQRVGFVLGLGIFAALICHLSYWNWMRFPLPYTLAMMVDVIVGWGLTGLVMAAIIRPLPPRPLGAADAEG